MADVITTDPIMSLADAKEWGGFTDDDQTIRLINIVSVKFLTFTQRARITEGAVDEYVFPLDGNTAFTGTRPISAADVTVIEITRSGDTTTYLEADDDVFCDRVRGRIYKTGGTWTTGTEFPSLRLQYTGGWTDPPDDVVAGTLAQMKVEQQRLKGSVGHDTITTAGDTLTPDRESVIKEAAEAWKPYRIFVR
jgi:hypothetical protein